MRKKLLKFFAGFMILAVFLLPQNPILADSAKVKAEGGIEMKDGNFFENGKKSSIKNGHLDAVRNSLKKNYVDGEILVKYKKNKINLETFAGISAAEKFMRAGLMERKNDLRKENISILKIKDEKTVDEKIAELKNNPNVESVQPNFQYYPAEINTDDIYKNYLWGLDNEGQSIDGTSGTNDADIDAPEAWEISDSANISSVIVAVIDTGVAYNHPDLASNMWDGKDCRGQDASGNSILGGCNHGYDFEDNDLIPLPTGSSHGTHIAGIIAAAKNNGKGVIGIAPNVKIMAIKTYLTSENIIKGINFAEENGAKIINASWVGSRYDYLMEDAIENFSGIFVAAAGNGGDDGIGDDNDVEPYYPASYSLDNIISVAATDQNDNLAYFSNYGVSSVDAGAPGENIYSAFAEYSDGSDEKYASMSGTSMAAPYVAGLAALIEGYNPALSAQKVKDIILNTGDDVPDLQNKTVSGKRINARKALEAADYNKKITSFNLITPAVEGVINETDHSVVLTAPFGTDVTALTPIIATSTGAIVNPASGAPQDFTNPVIYTVTAADGSTQEYCVTVYVSPYSVAISENPKSNFVAELEDESAQGELLGDGVPVNDSAYFSGKEYFILILNREGDAYPGNVAISPINVSDIQIWAEGFYEQGNGNGYWYDVNVSGFGGAAGIPAAMLNNPLEIKLYVLYKTDSDIFIPSVSLKAVDGLAAGKNLAATDIISFRGSISNSAKEITAFNFSRLTPPVSGVINEIDHTITVNAPFGTDVTALSPTIATSTGATVSPASGAPKDFTAPVVYTVTAEDGSTQEYVAIVNVAKSSEKSIKSFKFISPNVSCVINEDAHTISAVVPFGTDVTALSPTIATSTSATVSPASGAVYDFSEPVIYTVTAEDGSIQTYEVTVIVSSPPAPAPDNGGSSGGGGGSSGGSGSSGGGGGAPMQTVTDTSAPTGISIIINSKEATTTSETVGLTLTAQDASSIKAMISNNPFFDGASWINFSINKLWILSCQNGLKTVYAKFKDAFDNISNTVSASIILNKAADAKKKIIPRVLGDKVSSDGLQLAKITDDADIIYKQGLEKLLEALKTPRDKKKENEIANKYVNVLIKGVNGLTEEKNNYMVNFVAYGSASTKSLGAGERAGVLNSYKSAFGKLPTDKVGWEDVIKIANGRWPSEKNNKAEAKAKKEFKKIYKRDADMANSNDNAAVTIIAYGLRPSLRNLKAEAPAIKTFKVIYKHNPANAADWDIARAIAYSGAKR